MNTRWWDLMPAIETLVQAYNFYEIRRGWGFRNLKDIGPGIDFAYEGSYEYRARVK